MKSSKAKCIGVILCMLFWMSGRLICLKHKEQVFEMDLSATIIPQVIYTKAARVKVTLSLSDYPPDGTTISAYCMLTHLFNFTTEDSVDVGQDRNNTDLFTAFQDTCVATSLLQHHMTSHLKTASVHSEVHLSTNYKLPAQSETWKLETSTVTFSGMARSHQIIASCQDLPLSHIIEGLQLRCTLSSDSPLMSIDVRHVQDPFAILLADLSPPVAVNWPLAPPVVSPLFDREYPNPAYVEVAPCPCDLISGSCDINCCCDLDCDDVDETIFTCIEGLPGGFQTPKIIDGHCTYQLSKHTDWFPFLCLISDNSPYLGMYYRESMPIVQNSKSMRILTQQLNAQGKLLPEVIEEKAADSNTYQYGDPILTIVGTEEQAGYLTLPSRIFTGQCIEASPLAFLLPQSMACNMLVTPETCIANSLLSATTYLMDSSASDLHVLARKDMREIANVTVTYFCEERTGSEKCDLIHLVPSYNSTTNSCQNVVQRLAYDFLWDGPIIGGISVTIGLLPSFPVNVYLTQHFQSRFVHSSPNTSYSVSDMKTTAELLVYSGNPGYDIGKTLITGAPADSNDSLSTNETDFLFMDINRTKSVRLTNAGQGGACDARGQPLLFGIDGFSGCRLDVRDAFDQDCQRLRMAVLRHLCSLMPSTFVSKGGAPQQDQLEDFVPIIREDPCENLNATLVEDPEISNASHVGVCTDIPSYFAITVLFAAREYLYGFPIYQIEGMRIRTINTTLSKCSNQSSRKAGGCWHSGRDNLTSVFITSSVEFAETPADLNPKTKRFWLNQDSLPCSQDSCWAQIAYPFTDAQFGDAALYVTQCGLVLVAMMAITLYLTRPSLW